MKIMLRTGLMVVCIAITLTGCQNPNGTPNNAGTGALIGGALGALAGAASGGRHAGERALVGAAIGAVAGAIAGHIMDQINEQQRAYLQQQSPQTLQTIQHNDEIVQQQQQQQAAPQPQQTASTQQSSSPPSSAPAQDTPTPLTVDDIKALTSAGVKTNAIIEEIKESKATYTQADIQAAQQANPPIDPSVIAYMQNPT